MSIYFCCRPYSNTSDFPFSSIEPREKLEEKVARKLKRRAKTARAVIFAYAGFLLFGLTMMAGLFIKNTQVLTVGWVGMVLFGVIMTFIMKTGNKKKQ